MTALQTASLAPGAPAPAARAAAGTGAAAEPSPLALGFVDPLDLDAQDDILAFIRAYAASPRNADGAIRQRPIGDYRQAFATGLTVRGHRAGRTTFVLMTYPLLGAGRCACRPYVELGTVLSLDERRGLMEPVVRAVILRVLAQWPRAIVYAIAKPGTASAHVLGKAGLVPTAADAMAELARLRAQAGLPLPAGKLLFTLGRTGASTALVGRL